MKTVIPKTQSTSRVRVIIPFKAKSVETGDSALFPKGTVLWHLERCGEFVRFQEIGGKSFYEAWEDEFRVCIKNISR
jgi:hypothetical protein